MWRQLKGKDSPSQGRSRLTLAGSPAHVPAAAAGMQQRHTYSGMCLAQGAFSAPVFLAGCARRHICVYCRGWELPAGANYWLVPPPQGSQCVSHPSPCLRVTVTSPAHRYSWKRAGWLEWRCRRCHRGMLCQQERLLGSSRGLAGGHSWEGEAKIHLHLHKTSQTDKYVCTSDGCSSSLPHGWWTCRPLRRPAQVWRWPSLSSLGAKSI